MKHFESIDALRKYAAERGCDVELDDDLLLFHVAPGRDAGPSTACLFGWDDTGAILEGVYMFGSDGELDEFPWGKIPDSTVADIEERYANDCAERAAAYKDAKGEYQWEQARDRAEDAA
jgi:hypothetical protein